MGTASTGSKQATTQGTGTTGQGMTIGSPISNEAYNVLSALHAKLEGMEAFRKYAKDGNAEIWQTLTESDRKCVETLVDELETMVRDGSFRLRKPGDTQ